jgi:hypothetical protein
MNAVRGGAKLTATMDEKAEWYEREHPYVIVFHL